MTLDEAKKIIKSECYIADLLNLDRTQMVNMALDTVIEAAEETRWIPVSEKKADFPCLAVDKFGQIFIPQGIVTINNRCYDGAGFDFDVGKFMKGKEVIINGQKAYIEPTEVIAWQPLPKPYKAEGSDEE